MKKIILGIFFMVNLAYSLDFVCVLPTECKKEDIVGFKFKKANIFRLRANNSIDVICSVEGKEKKYHDKNIGIINSFTFSVLGVGKSDVVFINDKYINRKKFKCFCEVDR